MMSGIGSPTAQSRIERMGFLLVCSMKTSARSKGSIRCEEHRALNGNGAAGVSPLLVSADAASELAAEVSRRAQAQVSKSNRFRITAIRAAIVLEPASARNLTILQKLSERVARIRQPTIAAWD